MNNKLYKDVQPMVYPLSLSSSIRRGPKSLPVQDVVGFPVSTLSFEQQITAVLAWAQSRQSRVVCVSNVHMLMEGHWNSDFSKVLLEADLLTPDGMPLVWMTRLLQGCHQDRAAGLELMQALCKSAEASGVSIFFFGSTLEMLSKIRAQLAKEFPNLKIAGMVSPPFRPLSPEEDEKIVREINQSSAGLVFVSLGCPKQERWMGKHRGEVKAVMVGLGGAFSVYAGAKRWAPTWVRENGLEWLYRLVQEPGRLWKRYASTIPPFVWLAFKQVMKARLGSPSNHST
ncbi:MAG: WecB/TagA/CpsF family glycosyltransferase [Cyanobacteria bacterium J06634_6]